MNKEQLIEKLKSIFETVSNFADGEYSNINPDNYPKAKEAQVRLNDWLKDNPEPVLVKGMGYDVYSANYRNWSSLKDKRFGVGFYPEEIAYNEALKEYGLGEMVEIDSYGGEGKGEEWWIVYHFELADLYVKVNGYYQSYNGTDFGDWEDAVSIVKPVEKTITVYE